MKCEVGVPASRVEIFTSQKWGLGGMQSADLLSAQDEPNQPIPKVSESQNTLGPWLKRRLPSYCIYRIARSTRIMAVGCQPRAAYGLPHSFDQEAFRAAAMLAGLAYSRHLWTQGMLLYLS